jgi:PadR family transcriptional regulator, regulatory protein AphA
MKTAKPMPAGRRASRTRFVVLGMLTLGPAGGYELRRRIAQSVGHFWQESFGQLFPSLAELEREGLVRRARSRQPSPRGRIEYAITPAGRTALRRWLAQPPAPEVERNELLLKLFFGSEVPAGVLLDYVRASREDAERRRAELLAVEKALRGSLASDPRSRFWLLTLSYGLRGLDAQRRWAEECELELTRPASTPARARRPGARRSGTRAT